jgi:hypothetical protein
LHGTSQLKPPHHGIVPLAMTKVDRVAARAEKATLLSVFHPAILGDILKFNATMGCLERKKPRMKLVFQAGRDQRVQAEMTFLLGCHMIMSNGVGFEKAFLAFQTLYRDSAFNRFNKARPLSSLFHVADKMQNH